MKRFFAGIFFFHFFIAASPQNIDSLKTVINSSQPYSKKIKAYITYLEAIQLKNFDTLIEKSSEVLQLAREMVTR
ncbi:MAG: hypothetical protein C4308_00800 [Chitinophagaceae bacterium]